MTPHLPGLPNQEFLTVHERLFTGSKRSYWFKLKYFWILGVGDFTQHQKLDGQNCTLRLKTLKWNGYKYTPVWVCLQTHCFSGAILGPKSEIDKENHFNEWLMILGGLILLDNSFKTHSKQPDFQKQLNKWMSENQMSGSCHTQYLKTQAL